MKKRSLVLISVLAMSLVLMSVAPALAEPAKENTIVIKVRDAAGEAIPNCWVFFEVYLADYGLGSSFLQTDKSGKVTYTFNPAWVSMWPTGPDYVYELWVHIDEEGDGPWGMYLLGATFTLESDHSAKVMATYNPWW